MKVPRITRYRALVVSALLALVGLALVCWSVLQPKPFVVIMAMSVAQGIGTLSFLIFLIVVVVDLRRAHVFDDAPEAVPPKSGEGPPP